MLPARMSNITHRLAEFAAGLRFDDIPGDVVDRAKGLVLDQCGIALRARREAEIGPSLERALARLGLATGAATVIGDAATYTPPAAAFFNGNLGHCLDFDDTHARGSIHPSAPIVPAALAAAEMCGANGRSVIAGIIAGYEIQIRLSIALGPSAHYDRGFHPTATCGVFGAAAAAGGVLGLSVEQMARAFGLCGSQAGGSMQFLHDGAWNKPYHTGYAAMGGLVAATMAAEDVRGAAAAIEGDAGFLNAYAPHPQPGLAVEGLGEVWETLQIAVKPYPSCRYGHAAIDALIALRSEHGWDADAIEAVEIGLPRTGWNLIGDPETGKQNPKNYVDGQFSMPFVAAVALRTGGLRWDDYAHHLADPATMDLCRRIRTVVDPSVEAAYPAHMGGSARVAVGGRELDQVVIVARGEPENFLSQAELQEKFDTLAEPYLEPGRRACLAHAVLTLEHCAAISDVLSMTRPASHRGAAVRRPDDPRHP